MILNITYKLFSDTFLARVFIEDGSNQEFVMQPVKLGEFEYGGDSDFDSVIYAESTSIEFGLFKSFLAIPFGFHVLASQLYKNETYVIIYKNNQFFFRSAILEHGDYSFNYEKMTVEITLTSCIRKLKDINPRTLNPADIAYPTQYGIITGALFNDVLAKTIKLVYPEFQSVFIYSDLMAVTDFTFMGQPWHAPASYFGDVANRFWGQSCTFDNAMNLIKGIQNVLGCIGLLIGTNYYLVPRYSNPSIISKPLRSKYNPAEPNKKVNVLEIEPVTGLKPIKGLQINLRLANTTVQVNYGNVDNLDYVEQLDMMQVGGTIPNTNPSLTWHLPVLVPEFIAGIGYSQWTSVANNFYTPNHPVQRALYRVIGNALYSGFQNRNVYRVKLLGVNYDYNVYYELEESGLFFKARKIIYNYEEQTTEMELVNVTEIIQNYNHATVELNGNSYVIGNNIYGEILNTNEFLENNIPTNFKFIPGSTKLHRNGLRLKLNDDYTEGEDTQSVNLSIPAQEEDILLIDYVKQ